VKKDFLPEQAALEVMVAAEAMAERVEPPDILQDIMEVSPVSVA
jgi:hypothetical protein